MRRVAVAQLGSNTIDQARFARSARSAAESAAWSAESAESAADAFLCRAAEMIVHVLIEMECPGTKWLYLTEES